MNLDTYENNSVVEFYQHFQSLFEAEIRIFEIVRAKYPNVDMLDIGVGTGRTTLHFAPKCRSYVGLDYSEAMVRQAGHASEGRYRVLWADARDMSDVADASMNYVLFSFNGIDYVGHEDRLRILKEIRRVCRPGAYFAFSTHNLSVAPQEFAWRGGYFKGIYQFILKRVLNFPLNRRMRGEFAILNDGAHGFGLRTYYVRPQEQIRQLDEAGFRSTRVFEAKTGRELSGEHVADLQPYFLCVAS